MAEEREYRVFENGLRGPQWELRLVTSVEGYQVLWVQTEHTRREIVITPKGRIIRVSDPLPPILYGQSTSEGEPT